MSGLIDITGQRFGRLIVVRIGLSAPLGTRGRKQRLWECLCDCGRTTMADLQRLRTGNTTSCGCAKIEANKAAKTTHGRSKTRAYYSWGNMMNRCRNPNNEKWEWYGGKGITVCERWNDFENFYADMGDPPEGMSIDRYPDREGNYTPKNCRWGTHDDQCENRSSTVFLTHDGKTQSVARWAREVGISESTLKNRLNRGWPPEKALTSAVDPKKGNYDRTQIRANSYAERLAAVLLLLKRKDGTPLIPPEVEALGTTKILSHVQWDHFIPLALGGSDHFSNLQPLTKADHLEKTKLDIKAIAKTKRLTKEHEEFRRTLLTPRDQRPPRTSRWGKRPFPSRRKAKT